MWFGAVILIARSAAARLVTGAVNVTITGWATPTTAPLAGWIDATPAAWFGGAIAAVPVATDPATASIAVRTASHPIRIALTTVSTPPRRCKPEVLAFRSSNMPYLALSKQIIDCASRDQVTHFSDIAAAHAANMP